MLERNAEFVHDPQGARGARRCGAIDLHGHRMLPNQFPTTTIKHTEVTV
jgi:hypothetical protein